MKYFWADGFHPPKGVDVQAVGKAVDKAKDPKTLHEDSKDESHPLHKHLWVDHTPEYWEYRGRVEECRHIISSCKRTYEIGGKTYTSRVVEFVKVRGEGQWAKMDDILVDPELSDAYIVEVQRLLRQALDKLERWRDLNKALSRPKRLTLKEEDGRLAVR